MNQNINKKTYMTKLTRQIIKLLPSQRKKVLSLDD